MMKARPFRLFMNPRAGTPGTVVLPDGGYRRARAEITSWPGYAETPLRDFPALAAAAGIATLRGVKGTDGSAEIARLWTIVGNGN